MDRYPAPLPSNGTPESAAPATEQASLPVEQIQAVAAAHAAFQAASNRLRALHDSIEASVDPIGIIAPMVHANFAWLLHPQELGELWSRFGADLFALQMHTLAKLQKREDKYLVVPQPDH